MMMLPVERFSESAQDIPLRAAEIIQRYGHNEIDTEHVLLALIEQPQGMVSKIFALLNVDARPLSERLDGILRTLPPSSEAAAGTGQIAITAQVVQVLNRANEETTRMKDEKISTEHIFLAIVSERSRPAAELLEGAGVNRDRIIDSIQQLRGGAR
jgi:ATP-dependent Clp protease ATP-binding subunit ClpC